MMFTNALQLARDKFPDMNMQLDSPVVIVQIWYSCQAVREWWYRSVFEVVEGNAAWKISIGSPTVDHVYRNDQ